MATAWIRTADNLLLYAHEQKSNNQLFGSAITRLIYGVGCEFGEERLRLLRQRIFTLTPPNLWEANLIKVCAKRSSTAADFSLQDIPTHKQIDIGRDLEPDAESAVHSELVGTIIKKSDALKLVTLTASHQTQSAHRQSLHLHKSSRAVSAMLCDANDRILAITINTNATCQIRHAEINLFLNLKSQGIERLPTHSKLYTSLKPCRMCAAMIRSAITPEIRDPRKALQIISAKDDIGSFGRHSLLEGFLEISTGAELENQII